MKHTLQNLTQGCSGSCRQGRQPCNCDRAPARISLDRLEHQSQVSFVDAVSSLIDLALVAIFALVAFAVLTLMGGAL